MEKSKYTFLKPSKILQNVIDHYYFVETIMPDGQIDDHYQVHLTQGNINWLFCFNNSSHATELGQNFFGTPNSILFGAKDTDKVVKLSLFSNTFLGLRVWFTNSGFYEIFGIPVRELQNYIVNFLDVMSVEIKELHEKLENAGDIYLQKNILDHFFTRQLQRNNKRLKLKTYSDAITIIRECKGNIKIHEILKKAKYL